MAVNEVLLDDEKVVEPPDGYPDEPVYEVIDGVRVELPMSIENDFLANRLTIRLGSVVLERDLGNVVHEILFDLPLPDRSRRRRPDVAFVSLARWPADRALPPQGNHWPVAPDLAIEFVSPSDTVAELNEKLEDYFDAGVLQAWVIDPARRVVQIFDSLTVMHGLREPAEIDGGTILPGIRVPLAWMFAPRPSA